MKFPALCFCVFCNAPIGPNEQACVECNGKGGEVNLLVAYQDELLQRDLVGIEQSGEKAKV